jgi:hypothetical protein
MALEANLGRVQQAVERQAAKAPFDMLADIAAVVKAVPGPATLTGAVRRPSGPGPARRACPAATAAGQRPGCGGIPQQVLSSPPALADLASAPAVTVTGAGAEAGEAMVDEAPRVLHRYSLIDHDRAARYREVRVHQLVQRATRENLTTRPGRQGPGPLAALAQAAASALEEAWPEVEHELGQVLRANATALQQAAGPALWNQDEGGHGVLFRSANSLGETGQVTAARDAFDSLHRTALRQLGPDH